MSATAREPRDIPAEEPVKSVEYFDRFADLYKRGVEYMADIQTQSLDCAVRQNKQAIELWKQMTEKQPWAPRAATLDRMAGTLDRFADAQKAAIKLVVDQTRVFVDLVKDRTDSVSKTADAMSKFAHESFDAAVAAQKKAAEATIAETKSAFDRAREQATVPGSEAVADSIQKGFDSVIEAQKELMETAARQWKEEPEPVPAA